MSDEHDTVLAYMLFTQLSVSHSQRLLGIICLLLLDLPQRSQLAHNLKHGLHTHIIHVSYLAHISQTHLHHYDGVHVA